jgi:hypothetical protein
VDLGRSQGGKSNRPEEPDRGTFWRGTATDVDTRLRVGRAIGKNEEEVAAAIMSQIKARCNPVEPSAIASEGNDSYPDAMLETWGKSPEYAGRGRPQASCALEDAVYNLMKPVKTLRIQVNDSRRRWQPKTPAMAARLTDHVWTIEELMMTVVVPEWNNT